MKALWALALVSFSYSALADSYAERAELFKSGTPLDVSKVPDNGVTKLSLMSADNKSGEDRYYWHRNADGKVVVAPTGSKEPSDELNALHLAACPTQIYPPIQETAGQAPISWSSYTNQRHVKFDPDGTPRPVPLFRYTWKTASKEGKEVVVARLDVEDPGFFLNGYGNVPAQKAPGRFYLLGDAITSLDISKLPEGSKGFCKAFTEEYWPYKVTAQKPAAPKPSGHWVLMDMSGVPDNEKQIYDMLNNPPEKKWVWVPNR